MKEVRHKTLVPPGGAFHYLDADSGLKISHPYFTQLEQNARKHRSANNYPIGANWAEQFEDNVCKNTPTAECREHFEPSLAQKASSVTKALWRWGLSGFKVVTEDQYRERLFICQACEFFGGQRQETDFRCKKCGCKGAIKASLATEACPISKWLPINT